MSERPHAARGAVATDTDTAPLDVVGIGSMAIDRVHRAVRILGGEEKGMLRDVAGAGPVKQYIGGVVLNHLGWAAALGLRVGIFGRQADDAEGRALRAAMDRLGIARDITLDGSASTIAEIFVDDTGERAIYMAPGATSETSAERVRRDHADFIRRAARLTTEVSQLPLEAALAALEIARAAGIPTAVDLDVPPADAVPGLGDAAAFEAVLRAADLLKPAKSATRALVPEAAGDALAAARAIRARFGNRAVVVTDGAAGCAISSESFEGFVPARAVKPLDTTGAGDAFLGGLLAALHEGLGWEDAAQLANACGAACVEKLGAFPEDPAAALRRVRELYTGPPLRAWQEHTSAPGRESRQAADGGLQTGVAAALSAFGIAVEELERLRRRLDADALRRAIALVRDAEAQGARVHVTGIGKPAHVAQYAASLLSSTGTPATFLHATEAVHGSAGQIVAGDVVIAISNSGETQELLTTLAALRGVGAQILGVTGNAASSLALASDVHLLADVEREGGPLGLAPRASVAAEVLVLAALSAGLQQERGFTRADYQRRHPGGTLGARTRDRER